MPDAFVENWFLYIKTITNHFDKFIEKTCVVILAQKYGENRSYLNSISGPQQMEVQTQFPTFPLPPKKHIKPSKKSTFLFAGKGF